MLIMYVLFFLTFLPLCLSAELEAEEGIDPDYFPDTLDQNFICNAKFKGIF